MRTFKAYFAKEIMESIRQYRYLVLAVGIIVFSVLDPLMLKLLPKILANQLPGDLSSLFVITPKSAVNNYIKDLFQIGSLFVVFSLCSTLSQEINEQKFVFPFSKGALPASIVLAKVSHYFLTVVVFTLIGFSTAYYYSNILFTGDVITFKEAMISGILISIYFLFNIALVMFFSSILKKGMAAGFIAILINFLSAPLSNFQGIDKVLPYRLIQSANAFSFNNSNLAITFSVIFSIILIILTIVRMSKVEVI